MRACASPARSRISPAGVASDARAEPSKRAYGGAVPRFRPRRVEPACSSHPLPYVRARHGANICQGGAAFLMSARNHGDRGVAIGAALLALVCALAGSAGGAAYPKPKITSFTPSTATIGKAVIIRGSGFTNVISVTIAGWGATFRVESPSKMTVIVPVLCRRTSGKIRMTALPGGSTTSAKNFTVTLRRGTVVGNCGPGEV